MGPRKNAPQGGIDSTEAKRLIGDELKPINEQLAQINRQLTDSAEKDGWAKARQRIVSFGSPVAIVALIATLLAIAFGAVYQSFAHVKEETAFRTHTNDQLADINKSLLELRAAIFPGRTLSQITDLNGEAFAKSLPALYVAISQPIQGNGPDESTLRAIAQKLDRTDENAPDYWPTVLQFIRFASSRSVKDVPPPRKPDMVIAYNTGRGFPAHATGQVVLLDGGELYDSLFDHCRIIFTEHPVRMQNVTFVNCVFDLPVSNSPSPYLKKAAQELLASGLTKIQSVS